MRKKLFSLIGGIILGFIIAFKTLEYNGWTIFTMGENGEVLNTTKEWDFNLITNYFLIMAASAIGLYLLWSIIEKIAFFSREG
ncbi:hypothetical protein LCL96_01300 [Rossellomorea aquimaris]|uniref:hypothetical protein n=1 Tax=Rossellomorea aquimaris TaxID=189382 RepID=UPI001CD7B956|nr:hypothetical protein [Rossellomorea aquimaris]MCA1057551.1 hypothetical protein [Rossellomorea aquimaris]